MKLTETIGRSRQTKLARTMLSCTKDKNKEISRSLFLLTREDEYELSDYDACHKDNKKHLCAMVWMNGHERDASHEALKIEGRLEDLQ